MKKLPKISLLAALAPLAALGLVGCSGEPDSAPSAGDTVDPAALQVSAAHFNTNASAYGLSDPAAELYARSGREDDLGVVHIRFNQLYRGVKVFEGEAITHVDPRGEVTVTDALRRDIRVDTEPRIAAADAVATAMEEMEATVEGDPPAATLEILPQGARSLVDRLVWHVQVFTEDDHGPAQWDHFIDAQTGAVAWSFDSLETNAAMGTAKTMFLGDQPITTDFAGGTYSLTDPLRGNGNYTCDKNGKTNAPACTTFTRANNIFGNNVKDSSDRATAGADAHFGLQATWDYYKNMWNRNGIDNTGRKTYSRVHYGTNYQNAFWSSSCFCMTYGDGGSTFYPLVSLDVAGHEMSHGVMSTEANLTYSGESGGLNESSSDIFGTLVEYAANSPTDAPDFWVGERIYKTNYAGGNYTQTKALRYMDDPGKDGASPACWSASVGNLDVHYSSGPNNHMFWLLAHGGTSKCNGQSVGGVGNDTAARIWYKAITDYMTASSNYHGARVACLDAATALYGAGSAEYNAVNAAYAGINVQ